MIKKSITYKDYNGVERTKSFYFNLNEVEIGEFQLSEKGGIQEYVQAIIDEQDGQRIVAFFKEFILLCYGEKSPDGERFVKSKELSVAFSQTMAFVVLYMELFNDAKAAAEFFNKVIPQESVSPQ